jgi:alpha-beta hydrolase superfamily lysophospholipase
MNFLLNRAYSMGYARREDMVAAGIKIESRQDLRTEMIKQADAAVDDGRFMNAALYYRTAELYVQWGDPDKSMLYDRFVKYFYLAVDSDDLEAADIPFGSTVLPVIRKKPQRGASKGTIILHSGYDGYKEELYSIMCFLSACGYEVINFDVPWMSRRHKSDTEILIYEWEKLIAAILDYYTLKDVSIFGLSMGGWLALRAAALEPRIKRVIASSVSFDVNQYVGKLAQLIVRFARTKLRKMAGRLIRKQMESDPQMAWFFDHLMHVTSKSAPLEAADVLAEINEKNLHSELVTQDVLILTGKEDHLVPFKMHSMQVKALKNAASVAPVVFTRDVQGQNHCQIGNLGLALSVVVEWLEKARP